MEHKDHTVTPLSLLDTDLYKFTMQQAVLQHFPGVEGTYRFTHRDKDVYFTRECFDRFRRSAAQFDKLKLTKEERAWLEKACPYFETSYLDYLEAYRFNPDQLRLRFEPIPEDKERNERGDLSARGRIQIEAVGPWQETILWEVPLMACLSEIYFTTVDTDWDYEGQEDAAYQKATVLLQADCVFNEFGTRRRRSARTQELVLQGILRAERDHPGRGKVNGTSNVFFAMKFNVNPVGTIAHEWFMGVGAQKGYEHANGTALELWEKTYPNALLIALTDTFSTEAFYKDFLANKHFAEHWTGLRQDSGDPFVYAPRAKEIYQQLGVDHTKKIIIYSDALNVDKALQLKKQCDELGFKCAFGIGTSLSNDFKKKSSGGSEKSKALNMVIKLSSVYGKPTVKISDEITKNTGDPTTVEYVKELFGIPVTKEDEVS
ncbi:nicotinate phosphoribosyltransferase [Dichomitus squalens]|uniref:Nicotinate phosphoribosyltransferase n=2 Tax=Dichomitus squalens TaxID=114155 RepID=A0A4Q9NP75_9APHY|nr:nicotinate phosphoribosyltransferase [Dichomitus squalens LYAD-421 SS1]EJF55844.1 nicotinate phosphoribosyltransferase [Dichomitus squalens LYAD-421 SS1]TBU22259.1 nicotinate phosphoribosyltransferase [Dichomitus squalens]TBU43244.1 nicotinate phosphoribosyltransferase [Dichomitus squalens]